MPLFEPDVQQMYDKLSKYLNLEHPKGIRSIGITPSLHTITIVYKSTEVVEAEVADRLKRAREKFNKAEEELQAANDEAIKLSFPNLI